MESNLHFPARLYQIIEFESPQIIRWELDGKSFRIVNHSRLEAEVLPKYFRHGKVSSIQRQLNLYGFRCTNRGEDKGVFCHPDFLRGEYDLARQIRRKPKPTSVKIGESQLSVLAGSKRAFSQTDAQGDQEPEAKMPCVEPAVFQRSSDFGSSDLTYDDSLFFSICDELAAGEFFEESDSLVKSEPANDFGFGDKLEIDNEILLSLLDDALC